MNDMERLEAALLDLDGSCRDLSFDSSTWDGVSQLLRTLEKQFDRLTAVDAEGNALQEPLTESVVSFVRGGRLVLLEYGRGTGILTGAQVYVDCDSGGLPTIEITFWPEHLQPSNRLGPQFADWLKTLQTCLGSRRCYCRYENASWQFGDTGPKSGVFLVLDTASSTHP